MINSDICHASLFTGIGGFDLAAQWVGWKNIFQVEKDKWCRELLSKRFAAARRYEDIKNFSGHEYCGKIDVISGGFPCQPFSVAGKQQGKSDDRYLWKEMLRVIQEVRPAWVVGENVTGIIKLALDEVLSDLENCGYSTETFIIPACSVGAPHRRDRIWIVAHSGSQRTRSDSRSISDKGRNSGESRGTSLRQTYGEMCSGGIDPASANDAHSDEYCKPNCTEHDRKVELSQNSGLRNGSRSNEQGETPKADRTESSNEPKFSISSNTQRVNSHTTGKRLETAGKSERQMCTEPDKEEETSDVVNEFYGDSNGTSWSGQWSELGYQRQIRLPSREESGWRALEWPTEPPLCGANDGISRRVDRLRGLGNSIVPQVAYEIFSAINLCITSREGEGI